MPSSSIREGRSSPSLQTTNRRKAHLVGKTLSALTALTMASAQCWAHTDSLGWLISNDQINSGRFVVVIFYGSWHSGVIAAEGSLRLQGTGALAGFDQTNPFSIVSGFSNVPNGTVPTGLVLGQNYFFPDTSTGAEDDFSDDPSGRSIYNFQSATFDNLEAGPYSFAYAAGALTVNWTPSDGAINAGAFTIGAGGQIIVQGAASTPDIDTSKSNYSTAELNNSQVNPNFTGGTLTVDSPGTVTSNFTVASNNGTINTGANDTTFSGNFSGAGQITKTGAGTMSLTGTNTNSGGFGINQGTLTANGQNALGGGPLSFNGGAFMPTIGMTLTNNIVIGSGGGTLNTSGGNLVLNGGVTGNGDFNKTGNGVLQLNGTSTFGGSIGVGGGTLQIDGTLSGGHNVTVNDGGMLGGTGTIGGNVIVNGGGFLSPGASPGTLTVGSDVTLLPGSTFIEEIDGYGTGSGAGNFDRLIVTNTGVFTADGKIVPQLRGISAPANNNFTPLLGDSFVIVQAAGGVQGRFNLISQPTDGLPFDTRFDVIYGSNSVTLLVASASLADAAEEFGKQDGVAAGRALDTVRPWPVIGSTAADELFTNLQSVPRADTAVLLEQISGEIYATAKHSGREANRLIRDATIRTLFRDETADTSGPMQSETFDLQDLKAVSFKDTTPSPSDDFSFQLLSEALDRALRPYGGWFSGLGQHSHYSETEVGQGFTANYRGMVGGFDLEQMEDYRAGVGFSYLGGDVDSGFIGHSDIRSTSLFGYSHSKAGILYVTSSLGATYSRYEIEREVSFITGGETLEGKFDDLMLHADLELRPALQVASQLTLSPILGARSEIGWTGDFQESGSAVVALAGQDDTDISLQMRLGSELAIDLKPNGLPGKAWVAGTWLIESGPDRTATADFGLHGAQWTVAAPADDIHALLVESGISIDLGETTKLISDYGAVFSDDSMRHQLHIRVKTRW